MQGEFAKGSLYKELVTTKKDSLSLFSLILACRLVVGDLKQRLGHTKHTKKAILRVDGCRTWRKKERTYEHTPIKHISIMERPSKTSYFFFSTHILDRKEFQLK